MGWISDAVDVIGAALKGAAAGAAAGAVLPYFGWIAGAVGGAVVGAAGAIQETREDNQVAAEEATIREGTIADLAREQGQAIAGGRLAGRSLTLQSASSSELTWTDYAIRAVLAIAIGGALVVGYKVLRRMIT